MTLIEVLVALLILAMGLLGLAMLQTTGLRLSTDSYSRSQATFLAYDIIERMRANRAAFMANNYHVADNAAALTAISTYEGCKASSCACGTSTCNAAQLAQQDLGRWYEQQFRLLTGASFAATNNKRATIVRNGNAVTVTLYWIEQEIEKTQTWQAEF